MLFLLPVKKINGRFIRDVRSFALRCPFVWNKLSVCFSGKGNDYFCNFCFIHFW